MKIKIVISLLLVIALCSGCATSTTTEEVSSVNSPISAEEQAILDEMKAKENAAESTTEATTEATTEVPTEPAEINVEADVQKYLDKLPPLPSGNRTYDYEWSKKLNRITYYLITIDPVSNDEILAFMYSLETEYGFLSDGKEQWDEETNISTYGYSTDTIRIYVDIIPNDDGTIKATIWISYNPFI